MGPPGHCKIPGHSGTDFKHRKAFKKRKEYLTKQLLSKKTFKNTGLLKNDKHRNEIGNNGRSEINKGTLLVLSFFIVAALGSIIYMGSQIYKKPVREFLEVSLDEVQPIIKSHQQRELEEAYNFLASSGNGYLNANLLDEAQTEFSHALKLYEYGRKARIGLTKILIKKCEMYSNLCKEAEENIEFLIEMKYASEREIKEWKIIDL